MKSQMLCSHCNKWLGERQTPHGRFIYETCDDCTRRHFPNLWTAIQRQRRKIKTIAKA